MIIKGFLKTKFQNLDSLLASISKNPARNRLLKTIYSSGYFTDGTILSLLSTEELKEISRIHFDTIITDTDYKDAESLDIRQAIPKYLSRRVKVARVIDGKEMKVVRLRSKGITVYVEEDSFLLLWHRISKLMIGRNLISDVDWWFSDNGGPVVAIDIGSWQKDRLLGVIAPLPVEVNKEVYFGPPKRKRSYSSRSNRWFYRKVEGV